MKKIAAILGVLGLTLSMLGAQSVQAWHPEGMIKKSVQNLSVQNADSPADAADTAVQVKTGDLIRYTITVSNTAQPHNRGYNDLAFIVVTDELPAGVELVNEPQTRRLTYSVDNLVPGARDNRSFTLKVTGTNDASVIINEACFTGDSTVKDRPQSGCDKAIIRLANPQTSSTSTVKPTPVVQAATTMPKTGLSHVFTLGFVAGLLAYGASVVQQKRRLS